MRGLVIFVLLAFGCGSISAASADGKGLYDVACQTCHGAQGDGDGDGIPEGMLRPRPFRVATYKFDTDMDWQKGTDADLALVIRNGPAVYGGSAFMPAWPTFSDDELAELVAYIRVLQHQIQ